MQLRLLILLFGLADWRVKACHYVMLPSRGVSVLLFVSKFCWAVWCLSALLFVD